MGVYGVGAMSGHRMAVTTILVGRGGHGVDHDAAVHHDPRRFFLDRMPFSWYNIAMVEKIFGDAIELANTVYYSLPVFASSLCLRVLCLETLRVSCSRKLG